MKEIVKIRNLKKSFHSQNRVIEAVRGIDIEVYEGEIFGFLGPNGAGKTTTLRMLTTLLPMDSGNVSIGGYDLASHAREIRSQIGYVSQSGGSDRNATGWENVLLQAQIFGLSLSDAKKRAKKIVHTLALEDCIDRFVSTYSGGQKRRLDIALALLHHPKVLFLDEPTTGLDPQNRANLWDLIKKLKTSGVAVFLTSHYLDEVDFLSDRLSIIDHGQIVATGTSEKLKREISGDVIKVGVEPMYHEKALNLLRTQNMVKKVSPELHQLHLFVDKGEEALPGLLRVFDAAGISLKTISFSTPSLDDVFLQKTGRSLRDGEIV